MLNTLLGKPFFESPWIPDETTTTHRKEWIERNREGDRTRFIFHHELRKYGSVWETLTVPRKAYILAGMGIVMHPSDAAMLRTLVP